jgi:hypothetical protein
MLVTDDVAEVADFLESHASTEQGADRIDKYLAHEVQSREA